jgi:hypothetical protein
VTTATAKEAFAKAIEWSIAERGTDVSIYDGSRSYSIDEFASAMALLEIAKTVNALPSRRRKANDAGRLWLTTVGSEHSRIRYRFRADAS